MRFDPNQPISDTNSPYLESAEYSYGALQICKANPIDYSKYHKAYWEHKMWWQIFLHVIPNICMDPGAFFAEKERNEYLNL